MVSASLKRKLKGSSSTRPLRRCPSARQTEIMKEGLGKELGFIRKNDLLVKFSFRVQIFNFIQKLYSRFILFSLSAVYK